MRKYFSLTAWARRVLLGGLVALTLLAYALVRPAQAAGCEYWVAPAPVGSNSNAGTAAKPWATMTYAAAHVPDNHCVVWFYNGLYAGENFLNRRFTTPTTFQAINPYQAIFQHNGIVVNVNGARNMIFDGFELRHAGSNISQMLVKVDRAGELWAELITFRNNIFHDSRHDDLLKIHNGARFVTVENNVFYNQAESEQHIDANSVTDVVIQDNIFFNDFAGSGRVDTQTTKHFIMIKDSNDNTDGLEGSERVTVRRNIFLNWQGGQETFVKTGNDGKPYHEAEDVQLENNLFIGNSANLIDAAFGARGAKNITYANNTIVGDLPSASYAFRLDLTDANPVNENIAFYNNIWADPTGTMGADPRGSGNEFADGDPAETLNLTLDNNLYWNGGAAIPPGDLVSPLPDDAHRRVANPLLNTNQANITLPRWNGVAFLSGNRLIRQEFVRLVNQYGKIPANSPAIGQANPAFAPADDILGRPRSATPEMGSFEYQISLTGGFTPNDIALNWTDPHEASATSLTLSYTVGGVTTPITGLPTTARAYTLSPVITDTIYTLVLTARDAADNVLSQSNQLVVFTFDQRLYFPVVMKNAQ